MTEKRDIVSDIDHRLHRGTYSPSLISIRNVIKRFPVGGEMRTILKGVTLEVWPGEFVAIVGPSGNGKSTLLNMITGIDHPSEGDILVRGRSIIDLNEDELASWRGQEVGIVFQFFQMLPSLSLLHNVTLPMDFTRSLSNADRLARGRELLTQVGLAEEMHKLPGQVSGGQQQRAAIARALANDPALIIADEPTGNLDLANGQAIVQLFADLVTQGKTVIMVTHDMELATQASRVIHIVDGRIDRDRDNEVATKGEGAT